MRAAMRVAGRMAAGVLPAAALAQIGIPALAALVFLAVLALGAACWVISSGDRSDRVIGMIYARQGKLLPRKSSATPRQMTPPDEVPAIEPPQVTEPPELKGASRKARLAWWYRQDLDYGNQAAVAAAAKRLAPKVDLSERTARAYLGQILAELASVERQENDSPNAS